MTTTPALHTTLANTRERLLAARTPAGHWGGHLSSSALSTATALFALSLHDRSKHNHLINSGLAWLLNHQNADGGWGDTTKSLSNISTTALCWAALTAADPHADPHADPCGVGSAHDPQTASDPPQRTATQATAAAEAWLAHAAGSLDPAAIAHAIAARYGKDRTFSVPILTMCALAGRLGEPRAAWRRVVQLPFALAALPQSWYRFFRLPVVSYALPALISMGLARHRNGPSRNPFTRLLRKLTTKRALRVLTQIQPEGGGFLEATPLTSFVVMSLIGARQHDHGVVTAGVDFLTRSARPDGSWPIDTNLATWITTLSVNALAAGGHALPDDETRAVRDWLLNQQYKRIHPYTGAPPGAWAWTDLPGGVPDADDTAGALLVLHHLGGADDPTTRAACEGVRWLLDLQNTDGGIPTFCRGWTNLPFDRSGADLTAHALHAFAAWRDRLPPDVAARVARATDRALRYLASHQRADGSWLPLWFGNQHAPEEENPTYGTAKVLIALAGIDNRMVKRGAAWLASAQNEDGGWGGAPNTPSSIEETALAVSALAAHGHLDAATRGAHWLVERTNGGTLFDPSPIGFYFAKLWYFEREYPLLLTVEALGRLAAASRS